MLFWSAIISIGLLCCAWEWRHIKTCPICNERKAKEQKEKADGKLN